MSLTPKPKATHRSRPPGGSAKKCITRTTGAPATKRTRIDLERPGSILYKRTAKGMQAVGVMYTAPGNALPAELDKRVPLSVGVWHRHVHFCGWPSGTPRKDWDGPNARFGFAGSIGDEATCKAAGGYWIPLALGWMTHIYPNETERDKIWIGEQMMMLNTAEMEHGAHKQKSNSRESTSAYRLQLALAAVQASVARLQLTG